MGEILKGVHAVRFPFLDGANMGRREDVVLGTASGLLLVMIAILVSSSEVEARTVFNDDVVINADEVWADDTYEIHGNLTVAGGMTLHLDRAIVEIVGPANGSNHFEVRPGGGLHSDNSTIRGTPFSIGMTLAGISYIRSTNLENLWAGQTEQGLHITGVVRMEKCVVRGSPNGTAVRVSTGNLEAVDTEFKDMGEVILSFSQGPPSLSSSLTGCTFTPSSGTALSTIGVFLDWNETVIANVHLNITDCTFQDLTLGVETYVNSSSVMLVVRGTEFLSCDSGLRVTGNKATVVVEDCVADGSGGTDGFRFYVVSPLLDPIGLTTVNLTAEGFTNGIYILGPTQRFKPLLSGVHVTVCDQGVRVMGSTVYVEDSNVTNCGNCFYVENKARIEIRRTDHTYRSAAIAPTQQAAVVAFTNVEVTTCRWKDGYRLDTGFLYLVGDDGVELERVDLADPQPKEVVVWSLTRFNDLGRLWIVPTLKQEDGTFVAANFSIYNGTPQDVEVVDHLVPIIDQLWPSDGHWYAYSQPEVTGHVDDNGSGLAEMSVSIVGVQKVKAIVGIDGNWSVEFNAIPDGPFTLELMAVDNVGGTSTATIVNLTVDTMDPLIEMPSLDYLVSTTDITFEGRTEPHSLVHIWEMGVPPNHPYYCEGNVTADAEGDFNLTLCLGAGLHNMSVSSTDRAGNTAMVGMVVRMDPYAPEVSIDSPGDGDWSSDSRVTVTGAISDRGVSAWVKGMVQGTEVSIEDGRFSIEVGMEEGEQTVSAEVVDEAGNTASISIVVFVDTLAPVLEVVTPSEDRLFTTETRLNLQGEVVEVNLDRLTLNLLPMDVIDGLFTGALNIGEGENVFTLIAVDMAGNEVVRTITILRDLTPPVYTMATSIPEGGIMEIDATLYGTYSGSGIPSIEIAVSVSEWSQVSVSGGQGVKDGEGEIVFLLELDEGDNSFTLTVIDEAGNLADQTTYRIVLDTTSPEIRIDGPVEGIKTKDRNYRLRGRVDQDSNLKLDGVTVPLNTDGSFNVLVDLGLGENTFELEATDVVGLSSTTNVTIIRNKEADDGPGMGGSVALVGLVTMALLARAFGGRSRS
jgi:hypothetical protein